MGQNLELFEILLGAEGGGFGSSFNLTIATYDQFVGSNQLEEVGVIKLRRFDFVQSDFERLRKPAEPQIFELSRRLTFMSVIAQVEFGHGAAR